jgi:hypothetical protein
MWDTLRRLLGSKTGGKPRVTTAIDYAQAPATIPAPEHIGTQDSQAPDEDSRAATNASIEAFKQRRKLRELDVEVALIFMFFSSAEFISDWDLSPKGRRTYYEEPRHADYVEGRIEIIPCYSSVHKHFLDLERRIRSWHSELYLLTLSEQKLDDATATLEQKCRAAVHARKADTRHV